MPTTDGSGPHARCSAQELVSIERARQLREKAISVQRDDATHGVGMLARAAHCYEHHGTHPAEPDDWPGELEWDPQPSHVAALVRAGSLYQAEIDRLQHRLERVIDRIDQLRPHTPPV
ncbi:MAG TPA: hypothetical protein VGJ44_14365 [Kribbellaceae bacterium]|jgi:hypothetical protein